MACSFFLMPSVLVQFTIKKVCLLLNLGIDKSHYIIVQPDHLLAPEKRRGQEASGVRPMSNPMKKRLHKQKRACDTLFHGVCRLSELLRYIFYEYKF